MQAKDIPERPILELLKKVAPFFCHTFSSEQIKDPEWYAKGVMSAMPPGTPRKVALAKMRVMVRKGLVDGCSCGCRGDFIIRPFGSVVLSQMQ